MNTQITQNDKKKKITKRQKTESSDVGVLKVTKI